jgi:hypothetical protein
MTLWADASYLLVENPYDTSDSVREELRRLDSTVLREFNIPAFAQLEMKRSNSFWFNILTAEQLKTQEE